MNKKIVFGQEARDGLMRGIDQLANAVKATLGAKGRNVAYNNFLGQTEVTKDGVSVAKLVELEDALENMGANQVKQAAIKSGDLAGDGTTTATVLTQAIVKEGLKNIAAGANPMDLKRGIDKAVTAIVEHLDTQAIPVSDNSEIRSVATISANNDPFIGGLIADAYDKIGNNGVITIEKSDGVHTYTDVTNGMRVDSGYASDYFVTNDRAEAVLENPVVLIFNGKMHSMVDLTNILQPLADDKRAILIIADDLEGEVLASLTVNKLRRNLKVAVIKSPEYGNYRKDILGDIAVFTGATVISDSVGIQLPDVIPDMLGAAEKVIITKDSTIIVKGAFEESLMKERIALLNFKISESEVPMQMAELKERIAKLTGGVATLYVGANTDVELKEKMDRVDDAVRATTAAIEEGIVAGGGVALLKAKTALKGLKTANDDERTGINIVLQALEAPVRTIVENAGKESSVVVNKLLSSREMLGFDVKGDKYVNMFDAGIIDPKKVTRVALESAASVAGMVIITECVLIDIVKDDNTL